MGCDGGTIPRRDELVRMKKPEEKVERDIELHAKWSNCSISQEKLHTPIVSCELGRLFNKESVIEFLLDRSSATTDVANHIRTLKDVKELQLTPNPAFEKKDHQADAYKDFQASPYICPVVGIEMNGRYKFCFIWTCGCVLSERALKEIPSKICHKCGKTFSTDDVVILNGTDEDVEGLKIKMEERRRKAKADKKAKKRVSNGTATVTSSTADESSAPNKKSKLNPKSSSSSKDSKPGTSGTSVSSKVPELSKFKTVAEDPKASKVFKSLFTSGAPERPAHLKAHWVTFRGRP